LDQHVHQHEADQHDDQPGQGACPRTGPHLRFSPEPAGTPPNVLGTVAPVPPARPARRYPGSAATGIGDEGGDVVGRRQQVRLLAVVGGVVLIAAAVVLIAVHAPGGDRPPARAACPDTCPRTYTLRFGTAANTVARLSDPTYREVLSRQFSAVTAEDAMKWAKVEPARGSYDWADADRLVDFAHRNGQEVYGHTLVWHAALPAWLATVDRTQLTGVLRAHVQDEVARYRGKVWAWDVVNEAFNADGTLRDSIWLRTLGPDYIAQVFGWAHAVDPKATLFLNDFGIEDVNGKSNGVYVLVKRLRAEGVPIGGVGFQTHWTTDPLPVGFAANLRRFTALGVD